jgi:flagellar biosynthesis regulator FlbT
MTDARQPADGDNDGWRTFILRDGEQLVVNGALLAADGPCSVRINQGASVLSGKSLHSAAGQAMPAHELYYAALAAVGSDVRLAESRYNLFALLGAVVAQQRTHAAQEDCARFAAALISEDSESLLCAARRLATRGARALGVPEVPRAA